MNRSWRNTSANSSTGFVYFNTSNSFNSPNNQSSLDTQDFLSFGSDSSPVSSPQGNRFSPTNYSSPRKPYGKSPRQRGGRNLYYSPGNQTSGKYWRKSFGLSGSVEKNVTNSNNYQNLTENEHSPHRWHHNHKQRNSFHQNTSNQSLNTSAFYDPTCLQDPWTELEQKLAEEKKKNESLVESKSSQSMEVECIEDSSDESSSEDDSEEMEESFS